MPDCQNCPHHGPVTIRVTAINNKYCATDVQFDGALASWQDTAIYTDGLDRLVDSIHQLNRCGEAVFFIPNIPNREDAPLYLVSHHINIKTHAKYNQLGCRACGGVTSQFYHGCDWDIELCYEYRREFVRFLLPQLRKLPSFLRWIEGDPTAMPRLLGESRQPPREAAGSANLKKARYVAPTSLHPTPGAPPTPTPARWVKFRVSEKGPIWWWNHVTEEWFFEASGGHWIKFTSSDGHSVWYNIYNRDFFYEGTGSKEVPVKKCGGGSSPSDGKASTVTTTCGRDDDDSTSVGSSSFTTTTINTTHPQLAQGWIEKVDKKNCTHRSFYNNIDTDYPAPPLGGLWLVVD